MSKSLKKFLVITIMLMLILLNFVQATSIDMNLTNTLNSNTSTSDINQNLANTFNAPNQITNTNVNDNTNIPSNPQTVIQSSSTSSLSNLPEANLGLSNILSIILIVIGVLLILLAIAILIRLKH